MHKRPRFERRHYDIIARYLSQYPWQSKQDWRSHVTRYIALFINDNPRFISGRFIDAATPKDGVID